MVSGDVLAEVDGVHVFSPSDLAPSSARTMDILVRHVESGIEDTITVPLVGYEQQRIPREYAPALVIVGLAFAWLLLFVVPAPAALAAIERRAATALRGAPVRALFVALFGRGPSALVSLLASVLVATFALGPFVIAPDADGAVLLVAGVALLAASRITAARGLRAAARAAAGVACASLVVTLALGGAVVLQGALHMNELVRLQGSAPWEAAAAQKPAAAVLALVHLGALFAVLRQRDDEPSPHAKAVEILDRLGVFALVALAVAVFFGGWRLPGSGEPGLAPLLAHALCGALFVAKTWALVAALRAAAVLAPAWRAGEARSFVLRRLVPALALAATLVLAARRLSPTATFDLACGATLATAALLLAARSALRIRDALLRPDPHASPFL
jgi:hypothetical protein